VVWAVWTCNEGSVKSKNLLLTSLVTEKSVAEPHGSSSSETLFKSPLMSIVGLFVGHMHQSACGFVTYLKKAFV
jgi:hypothetical protein